MAPGLGTKFSGLMRSLCKRSLEGKSSEQVGSREWQTELVDGSSLGVCTVSDAVESLCDLLNDTYNPFE